VQQGHSVAFTANGSVALIGGPGDADGVGAAQIFAPSSGSWEQQAKLIGSSSSGGQGVGGLQSGSGFRKLRATALPARRGIR